MTDEDLKHLRHAVNLAREALEAGDAPFGSVLVDEHGKVLYADRNRTVTGEKGDNVADATLHPEFVIARWAQLNLPADQRSKTTVYTSGEHCAMCSAAHAYCGLGPIKYVSSTAQYNAWMKEHNVETGAVAPLAINQVAPGIQVQGPVPGLEDEVKAFHVKRWNAKSKA